MFNFQKYIIETWNRICQLNSSVAGTTGTASVTVENNDVFENYLTGLFAGSSHERSPTKKSNFHKQLKALEAESREKHDFDVWQHWVDRQHSHPELYAVAMVVFATPSSQVSVERAFSALPLVLTHLRTRLSEEILTNILMIKLNSELFSDILPQLYDWKQN